VVGGIFGSSQVKEGRAREADGGGGRNPLLEPPIEDRRMINQRRVTMLVPSRETTSGRPRA